MTKDNFQYLFVNSEHGIHFTILRTILLDFVNVAIRFVQSDFFQNKIPERLGWYKYINFVGGKWQDEAVDY